jgi:hypothetical protein
MAKKAKRKKLHANSSQKKRPANKQKRSKRGKPLTKNSRSLSAKPKHKAKNRKVSKKSIRKRVPNTRRKSVKASKVSKGSTAIQKPRKSTRKKSAKSKAKRKQTSKKKRQKVLKLQFRPRFLKDKDGITTPFFSNEAEIIFEFPSSFQDKINTVLAWDGKELLFYIDREKLFPRAFQIILVTTNGVEEFDRANRMSAPGTAVIIDNIKNLIIEYMVAFQDNYLEYIDGADTTDSDWVYDPANILRVIIRFFYPQ